MKKHLPALIIVLALGTAAVWRYTPAGYFEGLFERTLSRAPVPVQEKVRAWLAACKSDPEPDDGGAAVAAKEVPVRAEKAQAPTGEAAAKGARTRQAAPKAQVPPAPMRTANAADDEEGDDDETPEEWERKRRAKFEALMARAEARKQAVLREGLARIPCLREAVAANKAFKKKAAEVEKARKEYGDTDPKIVQLHNEMAQLKSKVIETSAAYKKWKETHKAEMPDPEKDPEYVRLISEARKYGQ